MVMFASILTKAVPQYKVHQGNERQVCVLWVLSTIKAGFRAGAEIVRETQKWMNHRNRRADGSHQRFGGRVMGKVAHRPQNIHPDSFDHTGRSPKIKKKAHKIAWNSLLEKLWKEKERTPALTMLCKRQPLQMVFLVNRSIYIFIADSKMSHVEK